MSLALAGLMSSFGETFGGVALTHKYLLTFFKAIIILLCYF
jgi:hypothetical protein